MAKVEMTNITIAGVVSSKDVLRPTNYEYANKTWEEFVTFSLIEELVKQRKVIQRKLDAARKRFKRLTSRLNMIEDSWNPA